MAFRGSLYSRVTDACVLSNACFCVPFQMADVARFGLSLRTIVDKRKRGETDATKES
jgi:hypothetical protein